MTCCHTCNSTLRFIPHTTRNCTWQAFPRAVLSWHPFLAYPGGYDRDRYWPLPLGFSPQGWLLSSLAIGAAPRWDRHLLSQAPSEPFPRRQLQAQSVNGRRAGLREDTHTYAGLPWPSVSGSPPAWRSHPQRSHPLQRSPPRPLVSFGRKARASASRHRIR